MRALRVSSPFLALQLLGFVAAAASFAQTAPEPPASIAAFVRSDPRLDPREAIQPLGETGAPLSAGFAAAWNAFLLDHGEWSAFVDARNGRVESAEGAGIPWIPGAGNRLTKDDLEVPLGAKAEPDLALLEAIARKFVAGNAELFGVEGKELRLAPGRSGHVSDALWLVDFDVVRGGLAIEGARLVFRVGHGNLIQLGSERLPPPDAAAPPVKVTREGAHAALAAFLGGFDPLADRFIDSGSIHLLPVAVADDRFADGFAFGKGYGLLAVWEISFRRDGVIGTWRGRVDATTGEVIELVDTNSYAQASGGVASDTAAGTEVVRPMPFADLGGGTFANTAGIYTFNGTPLTSTLNGKLARAADTCGAISLTTNANGNLPFGTAAGNNCTTPGVGGAGNTRSSRTSFYSVNRGKEIALGWLPGNAWLNGQLTANVNNTGTCNGFWNGSTLQLYRAIPGSCGASGEEPGFILHEFGHGVDANDGNGLNGSSSEAYADATAAITLHDSCVGPGFATSNACWGGAYGDACTSCSGLRDIDWAKHVSNTPATVANFTQVHCGFGSGPCGREVHCESYVPTEAIWDFANRDLPSPGSGAAWNVLERLWYLSRSSATAAFSCTPGGTFTSNGCNVGSWWKTMRAVDDDDGNLNNGTPHSCNLYAAFNRHGIACTTDAGANTCLRGCVQPAVPAVTLTAGNNATTVSWTSSGAGVVYDVYRSEMGCNSGFTKVANDVAGTSFVDTGVAGGGTYSYQVVAQPSGNEACHASPSTCQAVTLPVYYSCNVTPLFGFHTCNENIVTVTSSSGVQFAVRVDLAAGWKRLDVFGSLCNATGFTMHLADSPTCNGFGGDAGTTTHDAETYLNGTNFETYAAGDPQIVERNAIAASGCFKVQWTILENRILFDDDGDPTDSPKITLDSINGFEVAPYDEPDSEDPSGADANRWYVGLNRMVQATAGRTGTGVDNACFVLSSTTTPDPAVLQSLCP